MDLTPAPHEGDLVKQDQAACVGDRLSTFRLLSISLPPTTMDWQVIGFRTPQDH